VKRKQLPRKRYLLLCTFWKLKGNTCTPVHSRAARCRSRGRCNIMRRDEESERAMKVTGARPTLDNRQKFPIIKRTGVYTGNQFWIYPRRLRGIRRACTRLRVNDPRSIQH